jgi:NADPH2:quinone reductase
MKALVAQELSGPSGLAYTDVDDVVGGEAIVIDVGAAGVSFPELLMLRGQYQLRLEPPFIPGMEVAGVVRSAPYESEFKPGQRVTGLAMFGGWAERAAVPPERLRPTPDDIDDAQAVALLGNYQTMYFALARRGALRRGETVLVLGSGGGIGTASVQIAKALGAKVIAMVHRPEATEFVNSLGADVVLPLADGWLQAVKEHTDGRGVDLVVDPIGGAAFDDAIRALDTEGRLLVIGFAAGGIPSIKVNRFALAQRQCHRRRLRRVRQPQARIPIVVRIRSQRTGEGRTAATTTSQVHAGRRPRRGAGARRRRGARQGRAGALDEPTGACVRCLRHGR